MPERGVQFDYPENDWAVGKMAKIGPMRGGAGASEFRELEGQRKRRESRVSQNEPTLSQEEYQQWLSGKPEGPRLRYGKDNPLTNVLKDHPEGFLVDRDHPGLNDLKGTHDLLNLPGEGNGGPWFARPKRQEGAPVAAWQGPGPGVG